MKGCSPMLIFQISKGFLWD